MDSYSYYSLFKKKFLNLQKKYNCDEKKSIMCIFEYYYGMLEILYCLSLSSYELKLGFTRWLEECPILAF